MEERQPAGANDWKKSIDWAVEALTAAQRSFEPRRRFQEVVHPRNRKALYARLLVSYFSQNRQLVLRVSGQLRRYRRPLSALLDVKDRWAGRKGGVVALEEAILLDYDGLSSPAAFQQLWAEVAPYRDQIASLAETLTSAQELARDAGLRAEWAAPMVLAAWLRYLVRRRILPPEYRRRSFSLWPSGPRTIERAPPTIAVEYSWDPESETRDSARTAVMERVDQRLNEIVRSYEAEGYERINVRNISRDVEATYLRISDPERWSWSALSKRFEDTGGAAPDGSPPLFSPSGVRSAVGRVLDLLEIEPPKKRPGRRSTRL